MLEHVPDPYSVVQTCAKMVKPNSPLFFSPLIAIESLSYLQLLVLRYVFTTFTARHSRICKIYSPLRASQLVREANLQVNQMTGLLFNPLTKKILISDSDMDVNYMISTQNARF